VTVGRGRNLLPAAPLPRRGAGRTGSPLARGRGGRAAGRPARGLRPGGAHRPPRRAGDWSSRSPSTCRWPGAAAHVPAARRSSPAGRRWTGRRRSGQGRSPVILAGDAVAGRGPAPPRGLAGPRGAGPRRAMASVPLPTDHLWRARCRPSPRRSRRSGPTTWCCRRDTGIPPVRDEPRTGLRDRGAGHLEVDPPRSPGASRRRLGERRGGRADRPRGASAPRPRSAARGRDRRPSPRSAAPPGRARRAPGLPPAGSPARSATRWARDLLVDRRSPPGAACAPPRAAPPPPGWRTAARARLGPPTAVGAKIADPRGA
jgi:hypothetical protein